MRLLKEAVQLMSIRKNLTTSIHKRGSFWYRGGSPDNTNSENVEAVLSQIDKKFDQVWQKYIKGID